MSFPLRRLAASAVVLVAACGDAAAPASAPAPSAIEVPLGRLEAHVRTLAHDSMCGRLAGTGYERQAAEYIAEQFAEANLLPGGTNGFLQLVPGAEPRRMPAATATCAETPATQSQNVIGMLPGQGLLAEQWIVVSAHYDHLGWEAVNGEAVVFNGADDNASGTAVMLEVARALAAWVDAHTAALPASYRSVMFHGYGAEEIGLVGSEQYVAAPVVPINDHYAVVNLDMVGRLRENTVIVAGASTAPGWPGLLSASAPEGLSFAFSDASLARSDQWSFIGLYGVPGLHLFTGPHDDYHTPRDDPPLLDSRGMQTVARLTLGLVWELMRLEDALGT